MDQPVVIYLNDLVLQFAPDALGGFLSGFLMSLAHLQP
jgi:hypothetical protein